MPSLRQRMTTYLRQLSFVHEQPRGDESPRLNIHTNKHRSATAATPTTTPTTNRRDAGGSGCIVTQYLEGRLTTAANADDDHTAIRSGKEPADLPELVLADGAFASATATVPVTAACTGPDEGLCGVRRSRLHLSAGPEIDFIDTAQDDADDCALTVRPSTPPTSQRRVPGSAVKKMTSADAPDSNANRTHENTVRPAALPAVQPVRLTPTSVTINIVVNTVHAAVVTDAVQTAQTAVNNNTTTTATAAAKPASATIASGSTAADVAANSLPVLAAVPNWHLENDHAYGLSVSLYEQHFVTSERIGDPIADCYGLVVRGQSAVMAMADGVNWGDGARLAARSAVQGCIEYLDTAIFGRGTCTQTRATTRDVFVSLLRSFWEAHSCILDVGGALSTLTACVILPLAATTSDREDERFVVCACNVGDSFGYVYSKRDGVREFTQGSHDTTGMRDMRDALGALGPVQGDKPELGNLTLSMTIVEPGDIVFLTSDGISDNFDPVVGKFAEPRQPPPTTTTTTTTSQSDASAALQPTTPSTTTPTKLLQHLAPKRQNRSTSAIPSSHTPSTSSSSTSAAATKPRPPLVTQKSEPSTARRPPGTKPPRPSSASTAAAILSPQRHHHLHHQQQYNRAAPITTLNANNSTTASPPHQSSSRRPAFLRSHTVIEPRSATARKLSTRLPLVSGAQRHALTLLRLEDLLCYGINGTRHPCPSARKLCHLLVDFARMITAARRGLLEQRDLYYRQTVDPVTRERGEAELTRLQQRSARKRLIDSPMFGQLPGKLDHASVVAFTVERLAVTRAQQLPPAGQRAAATASLQMRGASGPTSLPLVETDF